MIEKFSRRYAHASLEVRYKAPLLMVIMVVLNFLALFLVLGDLAANKSLSDILSHSFLYLIVLVSTMGVYYGKYVLVGNSFFIITEFAFFVLRMAEPYGGANSISLYAAILGSFLVFGAVFISSIKTLFGLCGFYFLTYISYLIFVGVPSRDKYPLSVDDMLYPTIAVIAIVTALTITRIIFDRILNSNQEALKSMQEKETWARGLAASSTRQMAKAAALLTDARETSQDSLKIEENVHTIDARFNMLYLKMDSALESLEEVKTSANEMTGLSRDQLEKLDLSGQAAKHIVESINKVTAVITDRVREVRGLTEQAAQGSAIVDGTEEAFNRVGELVDSIKNLAQIISDIAERTNLLAMNASIQAAHAGEAGKGFAVVATEVRTLSASTAQSASSIAVSIDDLVKAMEGAGGSLGKTKEVFLELTRNIDLFGEAIGHVGQNMEELKGGSHEILEANNALSQISYEVDEQALGVSSSQQSAFQAMESISRLASEMTEETQEISKGTSKIRHSMEDIQKLAHDLENQSRSLNKEIDKI